MSTTRVPKLQHHKASGRAVVTLNGKDHYLGRYGTPEATQEYDRLIREWLANGRSLAPDVATVNLLILRYLKHIDGKYLCRDRPDCPEYDSSRDACGILPEMYGNLPVTGFGPRKLREVRDAMPGLGWSRSYANHQLARLKRMFKFGVLEELVLGDVFHALQQAGGIRKNTPGVRETEPVVAPPRS